MELDLYWGVVMDTDTGMLFSSETVILLCVILESDESLESVVLIADVSCMAAGEGEAMFSGAFARVELSTVSSTKAELLGKSFPNEKRLYTLV